MKSSHHFFKRQIRSPAFPDNDFPSRQKQCIFVFVYYRLVTHLVSVRIHCCRFQVGEPVLSRRGLRRVRRCQNWRTPPTTTKTMGHSCVQPQTKSGPKGSPASITSSWPVREKKLETQNMNMHHFLLFFLVNRSFGCLSSACAGTWLNLDQRTQK